ncbi:MAG: hypothetical protein ACMXYK_00580 [Candidatus Woesearchaeota archaeon]
MTYRDLLISASTPFCAPHASKYIGNRFEEMRTKRKELNDNIAKENIYYEDIVAIRKCFRNVEQSLNYGFLAGVVGTAYGIMEKPEIMLPALLIGNTISSSIKAIESVREPRFQKSIENTVKTTE